MYKLSLIASVILLTSCSSKSKTDVASANLNGKVKSIRSVTYSTRMVNGKMGEKHLLTQDHIEYNEEGYHTYSRYDVPDYRYSEIYTFDQKGNPKTLTNIDVEDTLVSHSKLEMDGKRVIQENWFDSRGTQELSYKNEYKKGLLVKVSSYNGKGDLLSFRTYGYDINKNKIEIGYFDSLERPVNLVLRQFDARGLNMASERYKFDQNSERHLVSSSVSSYHNFDDKENWRVCRTSTTRTRDSSVTYRVIEREILYYD